MSLRFGRDFLSIPGPSVMPDRVLNAMHRSAPNIYEGPLIEMVAGLTPDLKKVAGAEAGDVAIYVSNGHGAWEAAVANTLSRGDKVLVLESGRFAAGWGQMAEMLGCEVETIEAADGNPVDPGALEARLREDRAHEIKAVLVVQVDTASSVLNDVPAMRAAIDAAGHPALFMVDCIACLGSVPFEFDAWGVDVMVAGSQKGLMTPPGLGFVYASEKARAHRGDLISQYWNWDLRFDPEMFYQRFCGTAPTHLLFALREALTMLVVEEGVEAAWARHRVLAGAVRACVAEWAKASSPTSGVGFHVEIPEARSDVVTTLRVAGFDPDAMRRFAESEMGLTLGTGLGKFQGRSFRIGHMGWLNPPMILGTLGTTEAALRAFGVPLESGLGAAAEAISRALPGGAGAAAEAVLSRATAAAAGE
jgi:alanine-glyoxylate transaminase/serine-glyoxylate transaminase/serine-pyruvate transaminase